jgi:hypothetical protein
MPKFKAAFAAVVFAGAVSAISANAATIDFNNNQNGSNFVSEVQSNGFRAVEQLVEDGQNSPMGTNISFDGVGPSNGTVHLDSWTDNGSNSMWTLIRLDRAAFALNSFDFASAAYNNYAAASSLTLTGTLADNTQVSQTFTPVAGGFQTFIVSPLFSNVKFIEFDAVGFRNRSAYDNFDVSAAISAVPESSTWLMMMVGFGLIGATARYRRKGAQVRYA